MPSYGVGDIVDHSGEEESPPPEGTPMTEEGSGPKSVFIPASLYGGKRFNKGDEIVLKVTSVGDDGLEAEYATEGAGEGEEEEAPPSANSMIDEAAGGRVY